jgi:hypothetical protein
VETAILPLSRHQGLGKIDAFALDQLLVEAPFNSQLEYRSSLSIFSMNVTPTGPAGSSHGGGSSGRDSGEQSALQTRAAFLKNWSWELVTSLNRAACARGSAQHGINPETGGACQNRWEEFRVNPASLLETLEFLRSLHRSAPYLFFNGNTFADIGRVAWRPDGSTLELIALPESLVALPKP